MSRLAWLCLGIAALAPVVGSAQRNIIEWDERCWEVSADALYWRPFGTPYQFGVSDRETGTNSNESTNLYIRPDYDWGFRLGGSTYTHDCCHLFFVDWYYLNTSDASRTAADNLFVFFFNENLGEALVEAKVKTRYNRVNIRAGRYISAHCDSLGYVFGGLRYVDIEQHREYKTEPTGFELEFIRAREESQFEGAAFEVGYGAHITEPCGFSLVGHVAGLMAIGERTSSAGFTDDMTVTRTYKTPGKAACLIGVELRLGVEWRYECGCYWFTLEAGYEAHEYFDALRFGTPVISAQSRAVRGTELVNAGFGGPFFGGSVRF